MKFVAEDDRLVVTLNWSETFFALKHRLVIPRAKVTGLEWQPEHVFERLIWRTGGTDIPGVLWAGHFRRRGQKYFLYLRQPRGLTWTGGNAQTQNTLVITTDDYKFDQVLLSCDPDIAAELINWWRGTSRPQMT